MDLTARAEESFGTAPLAANGNHIRENGPGLAGSIALHALAALVILLFLSRVETPRPQSVTRIFPVDIVHFADQTMSPAQQKKSAIPHERSARVRVPESASPRPPVGVAPRKTAEPVDELQAKLRSLARLRQPDTVLAPLDNSPNSDTDSTSDDAVTGDRALYSVRDFIRAAVVRRWSLNLSMLGTHDYKVRVHVQMTRRGVVTLAEIVDQQRFKTDAAYREIALSARNAVLLSSPFALPPGDYHDGMDMVLESQPERYAALTGLRSEFLRQVARNTKRGEAGIIKFAAVCERAGPGRGSNEDRDVVP